MTKVHTILPIAHHLVTSYVSNTALKPSAFSHCKTHLHAFHFLKAVRMKSLHPAVDWEGIVKVLTLFYFVVVHILLIEAMSNTGGSLTLILSFLLERSGKRRK